MLFMYIYCITTCVMPDSTDTAKSTVGTEKPCLTNSPKRRKQNKNKQTENVQTKNLIKVIY